VNASLVYGPDCVGVGVPVTYHWLRVQGIEKWFLTGDTKEPDNPDPTIQIGCFQVLEGYLPHQWNIRVQAFFELKDLMKDTIHVQANDR
jgi:hypothetical protein